MGIFALSLFAPIASAVNTGTGSNSGSGVSSEMPVPPPYDADSIENSLARLRKDKEDFKSNRDLEEAELAKAAKEKVASKKKAIEAKREELRIKKDEKRKAVLIRLLDIQIKQLGNTKERVAKMTNIKPDLKAQLNTGIDAAVVVLSAKKAEVTAATTAEQMKKLAKDIKDILKSKRDVVKEIVAAILASKADSTITAAEGRLADITAKIAELKASGQDTAALDSLLAVAQSKIAAATTKAGKEDLKGAISDLKEAYKNMKKALEKAEGRPAASPSPASTPSASYQCPAAGFVNCMPQILQPGETPSPETTNLCSGAYHQWIQTNCPNVQFTY